MGVPALFRWLQSKYPKLIEPVVEEEPSLGAVDGEPVPVRLEGPNPNKIEFDNLYLDMNGIIHPCCHPEGRLAPPTEEDMMVEIFKYIDRIFAIIRPRKVLYLAIDGVAPRAKMNQQRSRRFRAAMEALEKAEKEAQIQKELRELGRPDGNGDETGEAFDSNCITPGTPFMALVSQSLRYYISERLTRDAAWQKIKIIFSDASVPGEGEHKIMDYIRRQRLDPEHDPNTRHVIYGLDADLIMLSLATHEPHFKVLREDVFSDERKTCHKCGQEGHFAEQCPGLSADAQAAPKEYGPARKPFVFLDILTLRDYLEAELRPLDNVGFKFDLERAIDDWIFMCFFVGNDFLPHLPSLEIREGAIDMLIDIYKQQRSRLGGYICHDGVVDLGRAAVILEEVGKIEQLVFQKRREQEERYEENTKRRKAAADTPSTPPAAANTRQRILQSTSVDILPVNDPKLVHENASIVQRKQEARDHNIAAAHALRTSINAAVPVPVSVSEPVSVPATADLNGGLVGSKRHWSEVQTPSEPDGPAPDNVRLWEPGAKERYYRAKLNVEPDNVEAVHRLACAYAEGLCWVMAYYYQGCPSWKWYYPYHYAPFASDFAGIDKTEIKFEAGIPFRPFDQLMGVFPAASREHIPKPFHHLMTEPESDVIDFYPETFRIDLNGKRHAWQGVVLLPFIEEQRLLAALNKVYPQLSAEELRRNARGETRLYVASMHKAASNWRKLDPALPVAVPIDPADTDGLSGYVQSDPDACPLGATFETPLEEVGLPSISNVQALCLVYFLPFYERKQIHFKSILLPRVDFPPSKLTESDRQAAQSGSSSRNFRSRLRLTPSQHGREARTARPVHDSPRHDHQHQHHQHQNHQNHQHHGHQHHDQHHRHSRPHESVHRAAANGRYPYAEPEHQPPSTVYKHQRDSASAEPYPALAPFQSHNAFEALRRPESYYPSPYAQHEHFAARYPPPPPTADFAHPDGYASPYASPYAPHAPPHAPHAPAHAPPHAPHAPPGSYRGRQAPENRLDDLYSRHRRQ